MKIAVLLAGGLGDCLLGNRFVPAILERFNQKKVDLISVSEDEGLAFRNGNFIIESFPNFYNSLTTIDVPKVNFPTIYSVSNMSVSDREKLMAYDAVFEFTIDSLLWLDYKIDTSKYFYSFPIPTFSDKHLIKDPYILVHLFQRENVGAHVKIQKDFGISLVTELAKHFRVIHPVYKENRRFVESCLQGSPCELLDCSLGETWDLAKYCSMCVGVSSSIRLFPYHFNKPSLVLFGNQRPFTDYPAFTIRWGIFSNKTLPLSIDPIKLADLTKSMVVQKEVALFPELFGADINSIFLKKDLKNNNPLYKKALSFSI